MSLKSHSFLLPVMAGLFAMSAVACAASPTPPPAPAAPPTQAFQQASSGATEMQGSDDGIVFVEQERKEPKTHQDDAPITSVKADSKTARPQH